MKRVAPFVVLLALGTVSPGAEPVGRGAEAIARAENPIFEGADPHAMVIAGRVWIFPTWHKHGEHAFYGFESADLLKWERHGPILSFADVKWIGDDGRDYHAAWAPGVLEYRGRFYLYYSVGNQEVTPSRIGVAVADRPEGPYTDSGKALVTGAKDKFEAIDPMAFTDPKTDKTFLYCGGSNGSTLHVYELKDDRVTLAREVRIQQPPQFTEGAFMHERDGVYYLSYSHGSYRDATYSVHYATAPTPTGPWTYRGPILTSDATHKGPGHHAFLFNAVTGHWFVVYHRYDGQTGDGPYRGVPRAVCIDRVEYLNDGRIRPIVQTDAGVPAESFAPRSTTRPAR